MDHSLDAGQNRTYDRSDNIKSPRAAQTTGGTATREVPLVTTQELTQRHRTKQPGIEYRIKADGKTRLYSVRWQGKRISKALDGSSLLTHEAAEDLRAELRYRSGRGQKVDPNPTLTFAKLAEEWFEAKERHIRPRTRAYYRSALDLVLLPAFGNLKLAQVAPQRIARLIRDLECEGLHALHPTRPVRPLGRSSIENYLKPLVGQKKGTGIFALAVSRGLLAVNPMDLLTADERKVAEVERRSHIWSEADVTALFEAARTNATKREARHDYTLILKTIATLGLRAGEALGLQVQDYDRENGYLRVRRQWLRTGQYGPTKTAAAVREIPLPTDLSDELAALLRQTPAIGTAPLFASSVGTPLGHRNLSRRGFEAARDRAGLPAELTLHDLRDYAASKWINAGVPATKVARWLGHADAGITFKKYARDFDERQTDREALRLLAGGAS
jgi:integrase